MAFGLRRTPVFRRKTRHKVEVTARVNENREGVEVEEVEHVEGIHATYAWVDPARPGETFFGTWDEAAEQIRREEFDAMSPSDQALQILAGADPAGVARRRVALEQSAQLKKALDDAKAFQERMNEAQP